MTPDQERRWRLLACLGASAPFHAEKRRQQKAGRIQPAGPDNECNWFAPGFHVKCGGAVDWNNRHMRMFCTKCEVVLW